MNCELYLTSAADGTNCVWVSLKLYLYYFLQIFEEIINKAIEYKKNPNKNYVDKMLDLLGDDDLFIK